MTIEHAFLKQFHGHFMNMNPSPEKEAAFEELERMRTVFLSRVSHELRTPLTSIIGFAEIILDDPAMTVETRKEFSDIIKKEAQRLSKFVDDLLDFSSLQQGTMTIDRTEGDVVAVLKDVVASVSHIAQMKSLSILTQFENPEILAKFDGKRIFQAFVQLMCNAIKSCPEHGKLIVGGKLDGRYVELWVNDRRTQNSAPDRTLSSDRHSDARRQPEELRENQVGLAIAGHLVELHGGTLRVHNGEPESTTTFTVRFPQELES